MKTIFYILVLSFLRQHDCKPTVKDMQSAELVCLNELHFNHSDVPDISNFGVDAVDNANNRKMFACLFSKMGILDDEQKISPEGFDNFVDILVEAVNANEHAKKMISESLQQCKDIEGRSGGEIGFKLRNCIKRAGAELREKVKKSDSH
ncbi:hypothetical protein RN001_000578 [Aquatica leii]|uniref:Uncharacterized protein n=1 Tax=Aquatica leii TaxID=1421715 RepID=A0AAN7PF39_9COLE|nr:hypothetical protein RN001_000578 [Aquatica leii]